MNKPNCMNKFAPLRQTLACGLVITASLLSSSCGDDAVRTVPPSLLQQVPLPAELKAHIVEVQTDKGLGYILIKLDAKPSELQVHQLLLDKHWKYFEEEQEYMRGGNLISLSEEKSALILKKIPKGGKKT